MEASVSGFSKLARARKICLGLAFVLSCARLAHVNLLWADEDYHLAAALQLLHGKIPYRDFWYDKPPLNAVYYLLIGGFPGWPLRVLDALYVLLACYLVYRVARVWWGEAEGLTSAALLAFFTTFYLPSAVIPFAADALMMVPHLAAIYCALRRRPLSGRLLGGRCVSVQHERTICSRRVRSLARIRVARAVSGFRTAVDRRFGMRAVVGRVARLPRAGLALGIHLRYRISRPPSALERNCSNAGLARFSRGARSRSEQRRSSIFPAPIAGSSLGGSRCLLPLSASGRALLPIISFSSCRRRSSRRREASLLLTGREGSPPR